MTVMLKKFWYFISVYLFIITNPYTIQANPPLPLNNCPFGNFIIFQKSLQEKQVYGQTVYEKQVYGQTVSPQQQASHDYNFIMEGPY